jgi:hypothetical protein
LDQSVGAGPACWRTGWVRRRIPIWPTAFAGKRAPTGFRGMRSADGSHVLRSNATPDALRRSVDGHSGLDQSRSRPSRLKPVPLTARVAFSGTGFSREAFDADRP